MLVQRSNSLEELAMRLALRLRERTSGALTLAPETILIQSPGIQRYLTRQLALELGIVAGVRFPYPRRFFEELFDGLLNDAEGAARWRRETLAFVLFRLLGSWMREGVLGAGARAIDFERPEWTRLRLLLERDRDGSERFLLAERYASLFDQYVTFRPRMVLGWGAGAEPDDEQAELFRALLAELGPHHLAARAERVLRETDDETLRRVAPKRVTLVGGPGLPPIFLSLLRRLSAVSDVSLHSFSVCREFFGDAHPLEDDEIPEVGEGVHPLLLSLGQVGAHYQSLLEITGDYVDGPAEFRVPAETSVLTALQRDLLEGRERPASERLSAVYRTCPSVTLDIAHSPLREVEILREKLLGYFAEDPSLRPEDIVVLTPDISEYAPLVRAVFGDRSSDEDVLPFRIADQSERVENPLATVLFRALGLVTGRFRASEFLDVLAAKPVAERLGLSADDVERVAELLAGAQFYWGVDAEHRASLGLARAPEGTFAYGVERLFLGMVMADDGDSLYAGGAPFDAVVPGDRSAILGIAKLFAELRSARVALGRPLAPLADRIRELRGFARGLFGEETVDAIALFDVFAEVERRALEGRVDEPVPLSLATRLVDRALVERRQSTDFLSGGVTFCELLPLRTVPFRIACLLGLGQTAFPRSDRAFLESKILERPQLGDRSLRSEDKYLFLELLVATKEKLSLSYVGRSVQDNTEKPASVLVAELAATLERLFSEPAERPYLTGTLHPLQPFSPRAFSSEGGRPPNFRTRFYEGALELAKRAPVARPFLDEDVRLPAEFEGALDLAELVRFFQRPARTWLRKLSLFVDDDVRVLEDRESAVLDGLSAYKNGEYFLARARRGKPPRREVARARGDLPLGVVGEVSVDELCARVERVCERLAECGGLDEGGLETLVWRRPGGGIVRGRLRVPPGSVRYLVTMGAQNDRRRIAAWLEHLFLAVTKPGRIETRLLSGKGEELAEEVLSPLPPGRAEALFEGVLREFAALETRPEPFTADALYELARKAKKAKGDLETEVSKVFAALEAPDFDDEWPQLFGTEDPYRVRGLSDEERMRHPLVRLARTLSFPALGVEFDSSEAP